MVIEFDIKKLLSGEKTTCSECKKGYYVPEHKVDDISLCSHFVCNVCSAKIHIKRKLKI